MLFALLVAYRFYTFLVPSRLEIGPETTVIEGPLRADGRVDYVRAMNDRTSSGVTPANNAAVPLAQAFGPEIIRVEFRAEYFGLLGIPVPPLPGKYVIDQTEWMRRNGPPIDPDPEKALPRQFEEAGGRPWSGAEFPKVAAWLEANETPLELIVAATTRARFYSPLVGSDDLSLLQFDQPLRRESREAALLLTTRAMLRLGEGDIEGAWDDLLACHRLSRLLGRGGTLADDLAAAAITAVATHSSVSLTQDGQLTSDQARRFMTDLDALLPLPDFSMTIDEAERFGALDCIQSLRTQPYGLACGPAMRRSNERYDRVVDAFRSGTHRQRIERLQALEQELVVADSVATWELITMFIIGSRDSVSRRFAERFAAMYRPSFAGVGIADARAETRLRLLHIALMLAAYRADHSAYPDELNDLSPDYFTEIPLDPFLDEPFHYERTETGYRLYSVGANMTDDGGRTYDSKPRGDDILVETPSQATDESGS